MAVTLNGHDYTAADFLGYGYAANHPVTGLPRFPDSIMTDMLAELASASTILTGGISPGAAGAVAYSNGSAWVRSTSPTLASLTLSGNILRQNNTGGLAVLGGISTTLTDGATINVYGTDTTSGSRGTVRIFAGTPTSPTSSDGVIGFYTGGSNLRWAIDRDGHLSAGAAYNITTTGVFSGVGSSLTALNAGNLGSGTVPSARIAGSYTGLTGTGALNAGSITSGFGAIDVGADAITGGVITGTELRSSALYTGSGDGWSLKNHDGSLTYLLASTSGGLTVTGRLGCGGILAITGDVAGHIYLDSISDPAAPSNGAIWFTGTALKVRVGGLTKTLTWS